MVRRVLVYGMSPLIYLFILLKVIPAGTLVLVFPVLVLYTANDQGLLSRILKIGCFQWLGDKSYSIYMWHYPILAYFNKLPDWLVRTEQPFVAIINALAVTGIVLAVSHASYKFVEMPSREFINRIGRTALRNHAAHT